MSLQRAPNQKRFDQAPPTRVVANAAVAIIAVIGAVVGCAIIVVLLVDVVVTAARLTEHGNRCGSRAKPD